MLLQQNNNKKIISIQMPFICVVFEVRSMVNGIIISGRVFVSFFII